MDGVMDAIRERRTIRRFEPREVPRAVLKEVFEAARWAPSWANSQCVELVAVHKPEMKERLQDTVSEGNPAHAAIAAAPVVLGLCARLGVSGFIRGEAPTRFGDWFMFDLGLAAQNISLAAHALGLGTVIVGNFDHERAKDILNVPAGCELVALMPLGYPAETPAPPARRKTRQFTHRDTFSADL